VVRIKKGHTVFELMMDDSYPVAVLYPARNGNSGLTSFPGACKRAVCVRHIAIMPYSHYSFRHTAPWGDELK